MKYSKAKEVNFPIYRVNKLKDAYYKITSKNSLIELKKIGSRWQAFPLEAKILPDRNFIHDLIYDFELYWDESTEGEFSKIHLTIENE